MQSFVWLMFQLPLLLVSAKTFGNCTCLAPLLILNFWTKIRTPIDFWHNTLLRDICTACTLVAIRLSLISPQSYVGSSSCGHKTWLHLEKQSCWGMKGRYCSVHKRLAVIQNLHKKFPRRVVSWLESTHCSIDGKWRAPFQRCQQLWEQNGRHIHTSATENMPLSLFLGWTVTQP